MDAVDRQIVALLQENARMPNAEIARRVGMAPSAVLERVRKLEARGILQGYAAIVNPRSLGFGLTAFVFVRAEEPTWAVETAERLAAIPGVQEVHQVAGEDCFLVKVRVEDTDALGHLLRDEVGAIPSVRSTRTTIVLGTVKETMALPVRPANGVRAIAAGG
ncbi:MAG TPA: Lrp/AsnC family transcriptional regulator [Longimicrobiales bacterium]|nr:Lrp/AsnC family transcriptional regulator [Longimicrobiales bacterium]